MFDKNIRAQRGTRGETAAAAYYERRGYRLLARNFHTRVGELDLVMMRGKTLVFIEVKTRTPGMIDTPGASVTPQKQQKLIMSAQFFLSQYGGTDCTMRFDVAEVTLPRWGMAQVHCIENAFTL